MLARQAAQLLLRSSRQQHSSALQAAWSHDRHFHSSLDEQDSIIVRESPNVDVLEAADAVLGASAAAEAAVLAAAQAECWWGTRTVMEGMAFAHDSMGLPWWGAILAVNGAVRCLSLIPQVLSEKNKPAAAKVQEAKARAQELSQQFARATTADEQDRLRQEMKGQVAHAGGAKAALTMLGTAGLQVGSVVGLISGFSATSTLATHQLPSFTQGGLGWFTDLTVPDPYMALPLMAAVLTAGMVHSGLLMGASSGLDPKTSKTMQRAGYIGAAVLVPFGYKASSAIALMWVTTSALQLGSALLLKNVGVRALLGLPPEGSVPQPESPMVAWLQNRTKGIEQVAAATGSSSSGKGGSGVPPPPGNPAWLKTPPRGVKVKLR